MAAFLLFENVPKISTHTVVLYKRANQVQHGAQDSTRLPNTERYQYIPVVRPRKTGYRKRIFCLSSGSAARVKVTGTLCTRKRRHPESTSTSNILQAARKIHTVREVIMPGSGIFEQVSRVGGRRCQWPCPESGSRSESESAGRKQLTGRSRSSCPYPNPKSDLPTSHLTTSLKHR